VNGAEKAAGVSAAAEAVGVGAAVGAAGMYAAVGAAVMSTAVGAAGMDAAVGRSSRNGCCGRSSRNESCGRSSRNESCGRSSWNEWYYYNYKAAVRFSRRGWPGAARCAGAPSFPVGPLRMPIEPALRWSLAPIAAVLLGEALGVCGSWMSTRSAGLRLGV
jgi:hypothetical protein